MSPLPPERPGRLERAALWLLLPLLASWPLLLHPSWPLGAVEGELDNHVWMFWRAFQGLRGRPGPWTNLPEGIPIPLMDPVNLPLYALGALHDPGLGWNLVVLGNLLLALGGGWFLARQWVGPRAAAVGAVVLGLSPFFWGMVEFGLSESLPLGLLALHLAFLKRYAERGGRSELLGAGLSLGAFALSGWYHAFFALPLEAVVLPAWVRGRRWRGAIAQGFLALLLVLPSFLYFLAIRDFWAPRWHLNAGSEVWSLWWRWPRFGADLAVFVLPQPLGLPLARSTYLGLGVLALAALGLRRRWREAWPLALGTLLLLLLSLGYAPRLAGRPLGFRGPAWWLVQVVPSLRGLSHWYRAVGPATVPLAALAALGADSLRSRRWSGLLPLVVALDLLLLSPNPWPRPAAPLEAPAIYGLLERPGGVVDLPFDNLRPGIPGGLPPGQPARAYDRWQLLHGRPKAENYEGPDALLLASRLVGAADAACGLGPGGPPAGFSPGLGELEEELDLLREAGVRYLVLHAERARDAGRARSFLERLLGPPAAEAGQDAAWELGGGP